MDRGFIRVMVWQFKCLLRFSCRMKQYWILKEEGLHIIGLWLPLQAWNVLTLRWHLCIRRCGSHLNAREVISSSYSIKWFQKLLVKLHSNLGNIVKHLFYFFIKLLFIRYTTNSFSTKNRMDRRWWRNVYII